MKRLKRYIPTIGIWVIISIGVLIVLSLIALEIYVWITYGGKPVTEIPSWALWFMFDGGNK